MNFRILFRLLLLSFLLFCIWVYFANRELFRQTLPLSLKLPKVTILFFPPSGIRVDLLMFFTFLLGLFTSAIFLGPWLWRSWRSQRELMAKIRSLRLKSSLAGSSHPNERE